MKNLVGVKSRLAAVVLRAVELCPIDFTVIEGLRTRERQKELYAQGRTVVGRIVTWTLESKHIEGEAVDILPSTGWNDLHGFELVYKAMMQASKELNTPIRWGGDWDRDGKLREKGESDSPHFELI